MRPVRDSDPVTSWVAAVLGDESDDQRLRTVILSALQRFGPMTHDDLIQLVNKVRPASPSGVRTRTAELVDAGLVEQVPGMVAKSVYGRVSLLWRAVR